jgi:hypothetical protein
MCTVQGISVKASEMLRSRRLEMLGDSYPSLGQEAISHSDQGAVGQATRQKRCGPNSKNPRDWSHSVFLGLSAVFCLDEAWKAYFAKAFSIRVGPLKRTGPWACIRGVLK